MLLVNDITKQIIYSRGKNATTSIADPLQAKDPDWYIPKDINTFPFPYDPYREYTCHIVFRQPYERYVSGLLEDLSMLMMNSALDLKYYQKIINDNDQAVIDTKTISNGRTAVLVVDKTEEYFLHLFQQILKYNGYDFGFGDSYHMSNWLWHGFALQSICDKTIWIDLPNLDQYMLKHFDLELEHLNVKSPRDKTILKTAIGKTPRYRDPINNYLRNENALYDIIMEHRNEDFTLKDLNDYPGDAQKISDAVYNLYEETKNTTAKESMLRQFIWLIFQKHWRQN